MLRQIAFFLLLVLLKPYNATRQSKVFTFLRTDKRLPGPSMGFNNSLASGVFEFEFKTFVDRALVLYQDDNGISDHIQITFQNGRLWFVFYVSQNNKGIHRKFTSENKYNDFNWHTIRIERNASVTSFIVDRGKERKSFETYGYRSSFKSTLFVGGFGPDKYLYSNDLSNPGALSIYVWPIWKRGFFNACVRNIKYGETASNMEEITNKYLIYENKVEKGCKLNHCHKPDPICKNNGKCSPQKKEGNVICDCRWTGFTGKTCTETALELTLDGTYKMKHRFTSKAVVKEIYSFRIKTSQENAVLFYARGPPSYLDFTLIEIRSSNIKLVVNFGSLGGPGINYTIKSDVNIKDNKWHYVSYTKKTKYFTLTVDETTSDKQRIQDSSFRKMDYGDHSFLGEIAEKPYINEIKIQDFIWGTFPNETKMDTVNFVTGLYSTYENHNAGFCVLPDGHLPRFNRKLPSSTPKPMPNTLAPISHCDEGRCDEGPTGGPSETTTDSVRSKNLASNNEDEDDDDSSVTWIIVVTVIFALLLFAAIAFFVHKWNQRYSGDFQVNRKPIGPAGTIVHYQDAAHKEKQRQMKL